MDLHVGSFKTMIFETEVIGFVDGVGIVHHFCIPPPRHTHTQGSRQGGGNENCPEFECHRSAGVGMCVCVCVCVCGV